MRTAQDYVDQIAEAAAQACEFIEGLHRDDFLSDKRTQQAVILNLIIIGEAAARLIERFPEHVSTNPQVAWRSMRGMRNRIAHGYHDIDLAIVWETVSVALPQLLAQLRGG